MRHLFLLASAGDLEGSTCDTGAALPWPLLAPRREKKKKKKTRVTLVFQATATKSLHTP